MNSILVSVAVVVAVGTVVAVVLRRFTARRAYRPLRRTFQIAVAREQGTWIQSCAGAAVGPHSRLIFWGGHQPRGSDPASVAVADLTSRTVVPVVVAGEAHPGSFVPGVACDSGNNVLYLFGGWPHGATVPTDELTRVDLSAPRPEWTTVPQGAVRPPARNGAAFALDPVSNSLILACGDGGPSGRGGFTPLADLWRFHLPTNTWTPVNPSGFRPYGRWHPASCIIPSERKLYLIGGYGDPPQRCDRALYELDLDTNRWTRFLPPDPADANAWPPSLQGHTLTYDERANALVVIGGLRHGNAAPATVDHVWIFDRAAQTWTVRDGGETLRRRDHVAAYHPQLNVHVLIGGIVSASANDFYDLGKPVPSIVSVRIRIEQ